MFDDLTAQAWPTLRDAYGIGADSAAGLLIVFGDNPERIRSEAAFAKLCDTCPIPASSGKTSRHRLYRGGHRQANAALYRVAIVRMRFHQRSIDYVARRTTEGLTKKDIIRCLKRFLAPQGLPTRHDRPPNPTTHRSRHLNPNTHHRGINAVMESFWARMQVELLDRQRWRTGIELANAIFEYLEIFHNRQRRHRPTPNPYPIHQQLPPERCQPGSTMRHDPSRAVAAFRQLHSDGIIELVEQRHGRSHASVFRIYGTATA